jgi:hypothetical protein
MEILHLYDPMGNSDIVLSNPLGAIGGCGGGTGNPNGTCEVSGAMRMGDMKLIVGMWATCILQFADCTAPNGECERMCGSYQYPPGNTSSGNAQVEVAALVRGGYLAQGDPRNKLGAQLWAKSKRGGGGGLGGGTVVGGTAVGGTAVGGRKDALQQVEVGGRNVSFVLFNISADEAERHDIGAAHPALVKTMTARLQSFRDDPAGWHDPQWPPYDTCDTRDKSCDMQRTRYELAYAKKGCTDAFVAGA